MIISFRIAIFFFTLFGGELSHTTSFNFISKEKENKNASGF